MVKQCLFFVLTGCLLAQTYFDCKYRILLDEINLATFILGIVYAFNFIGIEQGIYGSIVLGGCLECIYLFSKGGLGFGDVKLGLALGMWLGPLNGWFTLIVSLCLGSLFGVCWWFFERKIKEKLLPFGPFIIMGAFILLVWENKVLGLVDLLIG